MNISIKTYLSAARVAYLEHYAVVQSVRGSVIKAMIASEYFALRKRRYHELVFRLVYGRS